MSGLWASSAENSQRLWVIKGWYHTCFSCFSCCAVSLLSIYLWPLLELTHKGDGLSVGHHMAIPHALMWSHCSSRKGECTFSKRWFLQMGNWQEGLFPDLWWSATDLQTEKTGSQSYRKSLCQVLNVSALHKVTSSLSEIQMSCFTMCSPQMVQTACLCLRQYKEIQVWHNLQRASCAATWMLPAFVTAPGELTGWKLVISNNSRAQNVYGPKTGINYQNSACDFPLYWAHAHVCVPLYLGWLFSWKILQNWLS